MAVIMEMVTLVMTAGSDDPGGDEADGEGAGGDDPSSDESGGSVVSSISNCAISVISVSSLPFATSSLPSPQDFSFLLPCILLLAEICWQRLPVSCRLSASEQRESTRGSCINRQ